MPSPETAHAIGITLTQQSTISRERMLSQKLIERFLKPMCKGLLSFRVHSLHLYNNDIMGKSDFSKSGHQGWHKWDKVQKYLKSLISTNEVSSVIQSYCDEYIFYNCTGTAEFKPDVPGRHAYTHSWYTKYPSKKAALNAILFTDFLLNLSPIPCE